ncbi:MAG: YeeE/YedE family protein [Bacteroidota bacterium]
MEFFTQPWPWYITGPLIGLMVPVLLLAGNKHFGISASMKHICAACIPNNLSFFKYEWKKETWNLLLAAGIILGAFIAGHFLQNNEPVILSEGAKELFKEWRLETSSASEKLLAPAEIFSWNSFLSWTGWVFMALGGFFVGFGTRWANGCTSGHAIMGLSLLNPGSLIAVIGFFIGGLFISHFILPYIF